jgi:hypothetical protein
MCLHNRGSGFATYFGAGTEGKKNPKSERQVLSILRSTDLLASPLLINRG